MNGDIEPVITDIISNSPDNSKKNIEHLLFELNMLLRESKAKKEFNSVAEVDCSDELLGETIALLKQTIQIRCSTVTVPPTTILPANAPSEKISSDRADKMRLEAALNCITDAVFLLDDERRVIGCNTAATALCGSTSGVIKGKRLEDIVVLVNERTLEPCVNISEKIGEQTGDHEHRCLFTASDGRERVVIVRGDILHDRRGVSSGMMLLVRDVTEKELLEEELLKVRKLESVGLLAGGIAHEFNNTLTGIITNLFMARMSVMNNEEACQLIADAEKAAFKATRLTKQLLTFSQGGAPIKEVLTVDQLIQETVGFSLSGSNVDYKLHFAEDLKSIEADKGQIDQVLNNLVVNAAQAMPEGGTIFIDVENVTLKSNMVDDSSLLNSTGVPLVDGEYVKISVRDEGPGIPRKHISKIFDPYFSTKSGSTGLGLTTAYSIISKHGGYISVESQPGRGTAFSCYLPAYIAEAEDEKKVEKVDTGKSRGRVLVMDDDIIIRTVVEKLLKKTGYAVDCVSNGADALDAYKKALNEDEPFEFVIMDLTIPGGMGGKETVVKLKEFDGNAKVVVFSGYSNDPILTNFKEYGFDGVLKKPFSTDELMHLIETIVKPKN